MIFYWKVLLRVNKCTLWSEHLSCKKRKPLTNVLLLSLLLSYVVSMDCPNQKPILKVENVIFSVHQLFYSKLLFPTMLRMKCVSSLFIPFVWDGSPLQEESAHAHAHTHTRTHTRTPHNRDVKPKLRWQILYPVTRYMASHTHTHTRSKANTRTPSHSLAHAHADALIAPLPGT